MKKYLVPVSLFALAAFISSCEKQDSLKPVMPEDPMSYFVNFTEDTVAIKLSVTSAREERIGNIFATAIEGKLPDSVLQKNSLIIRVTGDSAGTYTRTEILASYTDSAGIAYSNNTADTINKVTITRIGKKKNGSVEGSFTIRVSNSTRIKTLLLKDGKFSTLFTE